MQCLIIAAGLGRRLSSRGDSKPLVPLLGLPLIERVILNAKGAGLSEFCVVTGYQGERVRRFLDQLAGKRQVSITHVVNEEWQKNNGLSVLRAKNALKGNFVLLMTDHLFDEQVLMNLRGQRVEEGEVLLAVDRNVKGNPNVDIDDVTKVLVEDGRILDIGKDIERYNAYDTGVFLCTPAIFAALEESMNNGDSTLSGGVRVLAEKEKAKAFDIGDRWWIDVDDEEAFGKAERALIAGLDKPSDGPISRHLNMPLSTRITRLLLRTNLTPNVVSLISFALAVVGSLSFFTKGYTGRAGGGILARLSSVVDGCDGEIARLKH
nr:nucleotidyl transferase [Bacillota bacterium]